MTIPPPSTGKPPSHPTGQVFKSLGAFFGDVFIFVTEDGVVAGWQPGPGAEPSTKAVLRTDNFNKGAVYNGLGIAMHAASGGPRIYAANFADGRIDAFDGAYNQLDTSGKFTDGRIPTGFAPFNVQAMSGRLYVNGSSSFRDRRGAGRFSI